MTKHKVLIFKMGYSETLDKDADSRKASLGDVLRCTPLLHLYKKDHVTWVTSQEALPLIENNSYVDKLLVFDPVTTLQLQSEQFDTVINLEKVPGICALADKIPSAWRHYGFRFNTQTGMAEAYDRAFEVLAVSSDPKAKKENQKTSQELLFEMVGAKWNGEEYILSYQPKTQEKYDIGLNIKVGEKWPTKFWPIKNWNKLEEVLKKEYSVTRQDKQDPKILANLHDYMDWINSCKMIVTNDSLGLHLALAFKKKVLSLFGPTPHKEVYFYGRGKAILPKDIPECMPCYSSKCLNDNLCINSIIPEEVYTQIKKEL